MSAPQKVYLVSHTHWDREWYQTFHEFRVDLVRVMQAVLRELEQGGEYRHFLLDGQTVLLEDYLSICPEDAPRIRRLVAAGALALGPWYVLPDEFLVSGEAIVRNLLVGHQLAASWGGAQQVGYMPDSFGHFAQLPQILRRAGIGSFVYTRGNGDEIERLGHEFHWRSPDGSRVLAVNQCGGYCNAGGLGYQEIWHAHTNREVDLRRAVEQVRALFEKMAQRSRGRLYLLNNGCDHFPPQKEFAAILAALRWEFPAVEFVHGALSEYLAELEASGCATEEYEGDLLGGKLHPILSGVWSARIPLKQANDECQSLLARHLEPLLCYAHFVHGVPYAAALARDAWKLLMKNHPHDSICGCSIDEVHREMIPRFAGVRETATQLMRRVMRDLVPSFGARPEQDRDTVIGVFNPHPGPRTAVVDRLIVLAPLGHDPTRLALFDEDGEPVPSEIHPPTFAERFWGVDYRAQLDGEDQRRRFAEYAAQFPERMSRPPAEASACDGFLWVRFLARDVPAVGHRRYFLREATGTEAVSGPAAAGPVKVTATTLENQYCRVRLHPNGTLDITEKASGRTWPGLGLLLDRGDAGDEYDFSAVEEGAPITSHAGRGEIRVVEPGGLVGALEVDPSLLLPAELAADRKTRSPHPVECPVRLRVSLRGQEPYVRLDLRLQNHARDHRLQMLFPTPLETDQVVTGAHFYLHARPLIPAGGADWVQPHPGTHPQQEFSLLRDATGGLAVLSEGLPEIEGYRTADRTAGLALTLLRAVGWLSRDDFPSRRYANAGPTIPTPEAQCIGEQHYRLALRPFGPEVRPARIQQESQEWRTKMILIQGVSAGSLPGEQWLVRHDQEAVAVSAIKKHEERDTLIVRMYNLTDATVNDTLRSSLRIAQAWTTDLLERRIASLESLEEYACPVALGPFEIATIELHLEAKEPCAPHR